MYTAGEGSPFLQIRFVKKTGRETRPLRYTLSLRVSA